MLVGKIDEALRRFETVRPAFAIAPVILKEMTVLGIPRRIPKRWRDTGADAGLFQQIQPAIKGDGIIDNRGAATLQQLRHGDLVTGRRAFGVIVEDGQEFIQRGMIEIRA